MHAEDLQQKLDDLTRPMIHEALVSVRGTDAEGAIHQDWQTLLPDKRRAESLRDMDLQADLYYELTVLTDETEEGRAALAEFKALVFPTPTHQRHDVWLPIDPSRDTAADVLMRLKLEEIRSIYAEETRRGAAKWLAEQEGLRSWNHD